jgi:hypothetical protein
MTGERHRVGSPDDARPDLGLALFQLVVSQIDTRVNAQPGDLVATLAYLAGRIVQRSVFRDDPAGFRLDQSSNNIAFLRHDFVSSKLGEMKPNNLASALVESALLAGATRFPDFHNVRLEAHEMMQRRGAVALRDHTLSASPDCLAGEVQSDVDLLLLDPDERSHLTKGIFSACGHALSYARHHIAPVVAAELAMSVALYAGWLDQRKSPTR